jgi:hypothetical protein
MIRILRTILLSISTVFLSVPIMSSAQAADQVSPVTAAHDIGKGNRLYSQDGRFFLVLQNTDGNLVLYQQFPDGSIKAIWSPDLVTINKDHPYPNRWQKNTFRLEADGNLEVRGGVDQSQTIALIWESGTSGNPGATLAVQNDGNVVIYTASGLPAWSTKTCCR